MMSDEMTLQQMYQMIILIDTDQEADALVEFFIVHLIAKGNGGRAEIAHRMLRNMNYMLEKHTDKAQLLIDAIIRRYGEDEPEPTTGMEPGIGGR